MRAERPIRLQPGWLVPLQRVAWILATHPDAGVRDARQAIELPGRAADLTHHQDPSVLDALAAAYAAGSDFDRAAATAQAVIELANEAQRAEPASCLAHLTSASCPVAKTKPLCGPPSDRFA